MSLFDELDLGAEEYSPEKQNGLGQFTSKPSPKPYQPFGGPIRQEPQSYSQPQSYEPAQNFSEPSYNVFSDDELDTYEKAKKDYSYINNYASSANQIASKRKSNYDDFMENKLTPFFESVGGFGDFEGDDEYISALDEMEKQYKSTSQEEDGWFGPSDDKLYANEALNNFKLWSSPNGLRDQYSRLRAERDQYQGVADTYKNEKIRRLEQLTNIPIPAKQALDEALKSRGKKSSSNPAKKLRSGSGSSKDVNSLLDGMQFEQPMYDGSGLANPESVDPRSSVLFDDIYGTEKKRQSERTGLANRGDIKGLLSRRQHIARERQLRDKGFFFSESGLLDGRPIGLSRRDVDLLDIDDMRKAGMTSYQGKPLDQAMTDLGGEERLEMAKVMQSVYSAKSNYEDAQLKLLKVSGSVGASRARKKMDEAREKMEKSISLAAGYGLDNELFEQAETTGWLSSLGNAIDRGMLMSEMSNYTPDFLTNTLDADEMQKFIEIASEIEKLPTSSTMKRYKESDKAGGLFDAIGKLVFDNPGAIPELFFESMSAFLPSTIKWLAPTAGAGAATGAAIGAASGSIAPGPGTAAGAAIGAKVGGIWGARLSFGTASFVLEASGMALESMQELNIDWKNPKVFAAAWTNESIRNKIQKKMAQKGIPIAIADAMSGMMGGKVMGVVNHTGNAMFKGGKLLNKEAFNKSVGSTPRFTLMQKTKNAGAEIGADSVLGMGGEFLGQWASKESGEAWDWDAVAAEGVVGVGPGFAGAALSVRSSQSNFFGNAPIEISGEENTEVGTRGTITRAGYNAPYQTFNDPDSMMAHFEDIVPQGANPEDQDRRSASLDFTRRWVNTMFKIRPDAMSKLKVAISPRTPDANLKNRGTFESRDGNDVIYLNEQEFAADPMGTMLHESGHFARILLLEEGQLMKLWGGLKDTEQLDAYAQYYTKEYEKSFEDHDENTQKKIRGAFNKTDNEILAEEWFSYQWAKVIDANYKPDKSVKELDKFYSGLVRPLFAEYTGTENTAGKKSSKTDDEYIIDRVIQRFLADGFTPNMQYEVLYAQEMRDNISAAYQEGFTTQKEANRASRIRNKIPSQLQQKLKAMGLAPKKAAQVARTLNAMAGEKILSTDPKVYSTFSIATARAAGQETEENPNLVKSSEGGVQPFTDKKIPVKEEKEVKKDYPKDKPLREGLKEPTQVIPSDEKIDKSDLVKPKSKPLKRNMSKRVELGNAPAQKLTKAQEKASDAKALIDRLGAEMALVTKSVITDPKKEKEAFEALKAVKKKFKNLKSLDDSIRAHLVETKKAGDTLAAGKTISSVLDLETLIRLSPSSFIGELEKAMDPTTGKIPNAQDIEDMALEAREQVESKKEVVESRIAEVDREIRSLEEGRIKPKPASQKPEAFVFNEKQKKKGYLNKAVKLTQSGESFQAYPAYINEDLSEYSFVLKKVDNKGASSEKLWTLVEVSSERVFGGDLQQDTLDKTVEAVRSRLNSNKALVEKVKSVAQKSGSKTEAQAASQKPGAGETTVEAEIKELKEIRKRLVSNLELIAPENLSLDWKDVPHPLLWYRIAEGKPGTDSRELLSEPQSLTFGMMADPASYAARGISVYKTKQDATKDKPRNENSSLTPQEELWDFVTGGFDESIAPRGQLAPYGIAEDGVVRTLDNFKLILQAVKASAMFPKQREVGSKSMGRARYAKNNKGGNEQARKGYPSGYTTDKGASYAAIIAERIREKKLTGTKKKGSEEKAYLSIDLVSDDPTIEEVLGLAMANGRTLELLGDPSDSMKDFDQAMFIIAREKMKAEMLEREKAEGSRANLSKDGTKTIDFSESSIDRPSFLDGERLPVKSKTVSGLSGTSSIDKIFKGNRRGGVPTDIDQETDYAEQAGDPWPKVQGSATFSKTLAGIVSTKARIKFESDYINYVIENVQSAINGFKTSENAVPNQSLERRNVENKNRKVTKKVYRKDGSMDSEEAKILGMPLSDKKVIEAFPKLTGKTPQAAFKEFKDFVFEAVENPDFPDAIAAFLTKRMLALHESLKETQKAKEALEEAIKNLDSSKEGAARVALLEEIAEGGDVVLANKRIIKGFDIKPESEYNYRRPLERTSETVSAKAGRDSFTASKIYETFDVMTAFAAGREKDRKSSGLGWQRNYKKFEKDRTNIGKSETMPDRPIEVSKEESDLLSSVDINAVDFADWYLKSGKPEDQMRALQYLPSSQTSKDGSTIQQLPGGLGEGLLPYVFMDFARAMYEKLGIKGFDTNVESARKESEKKNQKRFRKYSEVKKNLPDFKKVTKQKKDLEKAYYSAKTAEEKAVLKDGIDNLDKELQSMRLAEAPQDSDFQWNFERGQLLFNGKLAQFDAFLDTEKRLDPTAMAALGKPIVQAVLDAEAIDVYRQTDPYAENMLQRDTQKGGAKEDNSADMRDDSGNEDNQVSKSTKGQLDSGMSQFDSTYIKTTDFELRGDLQQMALAEFKEKPEVLERLSYEQLSELLKEDMGPVTEVLQKELEKRALRKDMSVTFSPGGTSRVLNSDAGRADLNDYVNNPTVGSVLIKLAKEISSPERNKYVRAAVSAFNSLKDFSADKKFEDINRDGQIIGRSFKERSSVRVSDIPVRYLEDNESRGAAAKYTEADGVFALLPDIAIRKERFLTKSPEIVSYNIIHEAFHGATIDRLINLGLFKDKAAQNLESKKNTPAGRLLRAYDIAKAKAKEEFNGLTSFEEFLAEALSNGRLIRYLDTIEAPDTSKGSLFDDLINAIKDLLGLKIKGTLLGDVIKNLSEFTEQQTAELESKKGKAYTPILNSDAKILTSDADPNLSKATLLGRIAGDSELIKEFKEWAGGKKQSLSKGSLKMDLVDRADPLNQLNKLFLKGFEAVGLDSSNPLYKALNVYGKYYQFFGEGDNSVEQARLEYYEPMIELMREYNVDERKIGEYLNARAAPSRNLQIETKALEALKEMEKDPEGPKSEKYKKIEKFFFNTTEDGKRTIKRDSGISTETAIKVVAEMEKEPKFVEFLDKFLVKYYKMNKEGLTTLASTGMIGQDTVSKEGVNEVEAMRKAMSRFDFIGGKADKYGNKYKSKVSALEDNYSYSPLQGFEGETENFYEQEAAWEEFGAGSNATGKGFDQKKSDLILQGAFGRYKSGAPDPSLTLGNSFRQHISSAILAQKNTVAQKFGLVYGMMRAVIYDKDGNEHFNANRLTEEDKNDPIYQAYEELLKLKEPGNETAFKNLKSEFEQIFDPKGFEESETVTQYELQETGEIGIVRREMSQKFKNDPTAFTYRRNGIPQFIKFTSKSEGLRMADTMKNLRYENLPQILQGFNTVTRGMAQMFTSANPAFILPNFFRDVATAAIHLGEDDKKVLIKDALNFKNLSGFMKEIYKVEQKIHKGINPNTKDKEIMNLLASGDPKKILASGNRQAMFQYFKEAGGKVGYFRHESLPEKIKQIQKDLKGKKGWTKKGWKGMWQTIDSMNTAVENSIRASTFWAAIKDGRSADEAAHISRNVTVDFNQKGNLTQTFGALYVFFGASVNSMHRFYRTLSRRTPAQRAALIGGMASASLIVNLFNRLMDDDEDEEIPDYDTISTYKRDTNFILPVPAGLPDFFNDEKDTGYFSLPLPLGYNLFWTMGQVMGDMVAKNVFNRGGMGFFGSATRVQESFLNAFNPVGGASLITAAFPTAVTPLVELYANKNFMNKPIRYADRPFEVPKPAHMQDPRSTPDHWTKLSRSINEFMGGSDDVKGSLAGMMGKNPLYYNSDEDIEFDISGNQMKHLLYGYLGGPGQIADTLFGGMFSAAKGDLSVKNIGDIPVANRFMRATTYGSATRNSFLNLRDATKNAEKVMKSAKILGAKAYTTAMNDNKKLLQLSSQISAFDKQKNKMRRLKKQIEGSKALSDEQKTQRVDELQKKELNLMVTVIKKAQALGIS